MGTKIGIRSVRKGNNEMYKIEDSEWINEAVFKNMVAHGIIDHKKMEYYEFEMGRYMKRLNFIKDYKKAKEVLAKGGSINKFNMLLDEKGNPVKI